MITSSLHSISANVANRRRRVRQLRGDAVEKGKNEPVQFFPCAPVEAPEKPFSTVSPKAAATHAKRRVRKLMEVVSATPCVDGSELARTFFTLAELVGAPVCSAFERGSHDRRP
jgi:hypothetical protein